MSKKKFFYHNYFIINERVFCPRFETEQLVDLTQKYIQHWFLKVGCILEIGVGSGVIALSLKNLLLKWKIDAVDIDENAIINTRLNQQKLGFSINCWKSDLFSNVKQKYDVIIANLPYLSNYEKIMPPVLQNDPVLALFAGDDGLKYFNLMLKRVKKFLKKRYLIALEIGTQHGDLITALVKKNLPKAGVLIQKDYNQLDRFVFIYNDDH